MQTASVGNALTPPVWQRPSRRSEQSGRDGRALRAPMGWQPFPFVLQQQMGGSRLAGQRLYARSASWREMG